MEHNVEQSIWIGAPIDRVWQAVTDPAQIAQWLLPPMLGAQMTRNEQGNLAVLLGPMAVVVATLEDLDPPRQVTSRGLPDRLIATTYRLSEAQGGTQVSVKLSGLDRLPADAAAARVEPSRAGWEKGLANLKAFIDGVDLPYPEGYVAALFGYRRETGGTFAIERSIWIKAPINRVWQAVTEPEQIAQWFSPGTPWRGTGLHVGGQISAYDPETGADTHVEVIEKVEAPHQFMTRSRAEPPALPQTTVWTLAEEDGGTRLTITNAGYELEPDATRASTMEQNAFGFGMMLENFKAFIEGQQLPTPGGF